ncbi:hypothetical protein DESC_690010 [Desulfosarcina cetonica]|nr:hypothetical protein DESC_690010 [Desulfosarcina cetonica]
MRRAAARIAPGPAFGGPVGQAAQGFAQPDGQQRRPGPFRRHHRSGGDHRLAAAAAIGQRACAFPMGRRPLAGQLGGAVK